MALLSLLKIPKVIALPSLYDLKLVSTIVTVDKIYLYLLWICRINLAPPQKWVKCRQTEMLTGLKVLTIIACQGMADFLYVSVLAQFTSKYFNFAHLLTA